MWSWRRMPTTRSAFWTRARHDERAALGAFSYARNETWLHTDESVLPRARRARSSWNYLLPGCDVDTDAVLVSYDMNRLQALPSRDPHIVTLNATGRIDPARDTRPHDL